MNYAVIQRNEKNVAVFLHDDVEGRVVFKGEPKSDLHKAFEMVYDKPLVISVVRNQTTLRKKIPATDEKYLNYLLDKCIHSPFIVGKMGTIGSGRLDTVADQLEKEYL